MDDEKDTCRILLEAAVAAAADGDDDDGADEPNIIYVLNLVLSGTARLNVLLPTATILAFAIFAPLLTDDGRCPLQIHRCLTAAFLALCAASCVFFSLTDSFRGPSGRLHYGVATPRGIWAFGVQRRRRKVEDPTAYRLRWWDLFHAVLSVVAFGTFAAVHYDVVGCYYPWMPRKLINTLPLVVGFVVSLLFVLFPSKRRGIGYPFLLQSDAVYLRH
ncbi:uncharacterized protein LOC109715763 [Ananas comosus]|uniref:Uncharacterized protein LOC109715763 n=1 Tax=Ananas comosus TaxID=4615 RepID=A0A199W1V3_ANACO|nr:uncharacterized protein LOC109715763 [Ananas comosus]OAY83236.1 hypothetical protein ACMD2_06608 [Ananas comosus]